MSTRGLALLLVALCTTTPQPSPEAAPAPNPRLESARAQAIALAQARDLIRGFPMTTDWAIPPAYLERFRAPSGHPRATGPHPVNVWFPIGPAPIAAVPATVWGAKNAHETGRIISIAATPQGPIYAGAEFGGVWEYTRSTHRWRALTDDQPSPQIGAIAIDPNHPTTVYAGTGLNNSIAVCGMGNLAQGLLKSTNGVKWALFGADALAGAGIARIVVTAGPASTVLLATSAGVYRSGDGGGSWTNTYGNCVTDLAVSPASVLTVYAATQSGLIRSTDGGLTWNTNGLGSLPLPQGFTIQHFLIGVSRGGVRTDVLYGSVTTGNCKGWAAFRSPDGGRTWASIGSPKNISIGFCTMGQAHSLAVDPVNANLAAFGGGWLYIYNAIAKSWTEVEITAVAHSDMRAAAFDTEGHLYVGNDGGVWEVPDVNDVKTGLGLNDGGLQVTEFERGLAVSPDGITLMAGSQDNGTSVYDGSLSWAGPMGADGGAAAFDQNDPAHQFATGTFPPTLYEKTARTSWLPLRLPPGCEAAPLAISPALPSRTPTPTVLYAGGRLLCEYSAARVGGPMSWTTHPEVCPNPGPTECQTWVTALRVDPLVPSHVFAGWGNGLIMLSIDSGRTWKRATTQPLPGGILAIAVSPENPYAIAVTTAAGHVWMASKVNTPLPEWSDVTGNLPVVDGMHPGAILYGASGIIVGTDAGVFARQTVGGNVWETVGRGFPVSKLSDLEWTTRGLVAITYGRGAWEIESQAVPKASQRVLPR
jgi:hypothetical protein